MSSRHTAEPRKSSGQLQACVTLTLIQLALTQSTIELPVSCSKPCCTVLFSSQIINSLGSLLAERSQFKIINSGGSRPKGSLELRRSSNNKCVSPNQICSRLRHNNENKPASPARASRSSFIASLVSRLMTTATTTVSLEPLLWFAALSVAWKIVSNPRRQRDLGEKITT